MEQPNTGFQVTSVHSVPDEVLMIVLPWLMVASGVSRGGRLPHAVKPVGADQHPARAENPVKGRLHVPKLRKLIPLAEARLFHQLREPGALRPQAPGRAVAEQVVVEDDAITSRGQLPGKR